jgi:hypothetical protein
VSHVVGLEIGYDVAKRQAQNYSAKLFAGTRQRFSGFSQARLCRDAVLRILVTGKLPARGGGGIPQRIIVISRLPRSRGDLWRAASPSSAQRLPTLLQCREDASITE